MPAPVSELAAAGRRRRRGGQRADCGCVSGARCSKSVLLERRERLGGAATPSGPSTIAASVVSPCAYVLGLDEGVIDELGLRAVACASGLPIQPWVPFEDGTAFGQFLDDAKTQANLESLGVSAADIDGYWAYEELFDDVRKLLRKGERDTWQGDTPTRAEIEELLCGDEEKIALVFEDSIAQVLDRYVSDERIKTALYGQGIIGTWGGPYEPGTASIKLMHYQGDLDGGGPVWGYVEGGMGMVSFAIADAAREAGASLACGVPVGRILPSEGVELEDGTLIRSRTVICNADPKVALRLLGADAIDSAGSEGSAYRQRLEDSEDAQPRGQVQRRA